MAKNCAMCSTEFGNDDPKVQVCCPGCKLYMNSIDDTEKVVTDTGPSEDPRIFFYPLSFGELINRYSILHLKRIHAVSIRHQQETDYKIFKCKKSIQTNLSQIFKEKNHRAGIFALVKEVFECNAIIWRTRDLSRDERISVGDRATILFTVIPLEEKKTKAMLQLDVLLTGRSTNFSIFNGKTV